MTRKKILEKHLGNIHISDITLEKVLSAMAEVENKLNIDWDILAKQKVSLETAILIFKDKSKYEKLHEDPFIQDLIGILHLIYNLQDNNCKG